MTEQVDNNDVESILTSYRKYIDTSDLIFLRDSYSKSGEEIRLLSQRLKEEQDKVVHLQDRLKVVLREEEKKRSALEKKIKGLEEQEKELLKDLKKARHKLRGVCIVR